MHDPRRVSRKYVEAYAEPECALAGCVDEVYARALVVPAFREELSLLDGYRDAIGAVEGKTLLILVVNGAEDAAAHAHVENARLIEELTSRPGSRALEGPPAWLVPLDGFDVLLVDRARDGHRLPAKQGVGLARKIGCDLALALHLDGKVTSEWIHSTDADVSLSRDYFVQTGRDGGPDRSSTALLYPYTHVASGQAELDRATALYEIGIRYYVLGLACARSPYAFHTIGSTLAVSTVGYAQVRGFPRRLAGEDFYLLDKLSKVGPLERVRGGNVRIRARWSDRAPFGTGRGVRRIAEDRALGQTTAIYDPRVFDALGGCLAGFDAFVSTRRLEALDGELGKLPSDLRAAVSEHLEREQARDALVVAARESPDEPRLRRRVRTWFDGLRTLKLVHAVRARVAPDVPWTDAVARAPFCRALTPELEPAQVAAALGRLELALPARIGPTTV